MTNITPATTNPIVFMPANDGEETGRADIYGLLAALFAAPPSTALLESIARAPTNDASQGVLEQAWRALVAAAQQVLAAGGAEVVREEYEKLFIGIGKPEVMLYGSFYLSGFLMEKPLAALRTDLAQLGLERADNVVESEDHIASLCEVMRYLIASDEADVDVPPLSEAARLTQQKLFFGTHMQSWVGDMCVALESHRQSNFYQFVGQLALRYFEVEAQAFDIG